MFCATGFARPRPSVSLGGQHAIIIQIVSTTMCETGVLLDRLFMSGVCEDCSVKCLVRVSMIKLCIVNEHSSWRIMRSLPTSYPKRSPRHQASMIGTAAFCFGTCQQDVISVCFFSLSACLPTLSPILVKY